MGGQGQLLHIHDADSPPSNPVLPSFNLSKNEMRPYEWIHWAMAEKDYTAPGADHTDAPTPPADVSEAEAKKAEKEKKKNRKRHDQRKDVGRRRALLHDGQWDSCETVSWFDCF